MKNPPVHSSTHRGESSFFISIFCTTQRKKKLFFNRILLNCKGALFSTHKMKRMSLGYTKTTSADKTASIWGWMVCVCIKQSNIHGISTRRDRLCTVQSIPNYNIGIHKCIHLYEGIVNEMNVGIDGRRISNRTEILRTFWIGGWVVVFCICVWCSFWVLSCSRLYFIL